MKLNSKLYWEREKGYFLAKSFANRCIRSCFQNREVDFKDMLKISKVWKNKFG